MSRGDRFDDDQDDQERRQRDRFDPDRGYRDNYDDERGRGNDDQRGYDDRQPRRDRSYDEYDDYDDRKRSKRLDPHRGGLILALSIIGIMICWFTSPAAWLMGRADLAAMKGGTMDREGEGLTKAGMIIGAVYTIFGLVMCGGYAVVFVLLAAAG